jgi:hypothetical protein
MSEYHPRITQSFIDRMDSASFTEAFAGGYIARLGYYVLHMPVRIAKRGDKLSDWYGTCDLQVYYGPGRAAEIAPDITLEVEVKPVKLTLEAYLAQEHVPLCSSSAWKRKFKEAMAVPALNLFTFVTADAKTICAPPLTPMFYGMIADPSRGTTYPVARAHTKDLRGLEETLADIFKVTK